MKIAIGPEEFKTEHEIYWGCKALLYDKRLILLKDRQIFSPHAREDKNEQFMTWLCEKAVPWLRQRIADSDESAFMLQDEQYCLKGAAEPDGTFYLGAVALY